MSGKLALRDALDAHANRVTQENKSVRRANVVSLNPLTVDLENHEIPLVLHEDFELSQNAAFYIDRALLAVGDVVLMHQERNEWLLVDTVSEKDIPPAIGVPPGGAVGHALMKASGHDRDCYWASPVPAGGTKGQVLARGSEAVWTDPMPRGGTTGQVLAKKSASDWDTHWEDPAEVEIEGIPLVATLPTTGPGGGPLVEGQEIFFQTAAMADGTYATGTGTYTDAVTIPIVGGLVWHLRYRSGQAYPWECLGGAPLSVQNHDGFTLDQTTTDPSGQGAWGNFNPTGPTITVPRPGDYMVSASAAFYSNVDAGQIIELGVRLGTFTGNQASGDMPGYTAVEFWASVNNMDIVDAAYRISNAAQPLVLIGRVIGTQCGGWLRRLSAHPVRLG